MKSLLLADESLCHDTFQQSVSSQTPGYPESADAEYAFHDIPFLCDVASLRSDGPCNSMLLSCRNRNDVSSLHGMYDTSEDRSAPVTLATTRQGVFRILHGTYR